MTAPHSNRLSREKSPYLQQHAHNPVDWFAWGEAAFARARSEHKPIFLSIGYSTCHWCHVMERESFEDETVADFLNRHFVSIKVDREERPDVDKIYMTFVQSTAGAGGWPLNVFLTPELLPFFGGTYFPPESRHGRVSFRQLLEQIQDAWQTRREEVTASATALHARLETATSTLAAGEASPEIATLHAAGQMFQRMYDPHHGGFGGAPKFPQPSIPAFLLRYARLADAPEATRMVLRTCDGMAAGGIHDQLGGGFARYSVDAEWLVPHFEKMLYDNAQLAQLYLDAHLLAGETDSGGGTPYATTVRDILDYVLRDMTHPDGGFYSAEDADSEGHEGKFYCWTREELEKLLSPEEFSVAVRHFGITENGNFTDHSHPAPLPGQNVLSVVTALAPGNTEAAHLAAAKAKMLAARATRVRPHRDDKVLASWNGLMLGAMARAAAVLHEPKYRAAAARNLAFLQAHLWVAETKTLYHRWREGEHDTVQLLEAYAFLLDGVVQLYETTLEPAHLDFAIALAEGLLERFYDPENGGFWQGPTTSGDLILRLKDDYDGAEPSGNSVATLALLKLGGITGRADFHAAATATLRFFAPRLRDFPHALPYLLQAVDFLREEPLRLVIAGDPGDPQAQALLQAAHSVYQPNKLVLGTVGAVEAFSRSLPATDRPMAYVCTGQTCQPPVSAPEQLKSLLR